jgi:hypothetical protein
MEKVLLAMVLVLAIIFMVPIMVYGAASAVTGLNTPEGASPARFLTSVLVTKMGTAIAFVLIFYFARNALSAQWLLYGCLWWLMSETMYIPLSAYVTYRLTGVG